jgi:hypothetical protein
VITRLAVLSLVCVSPWTSVRMVNIHGFRTPPRVGDYVSVIPLGVGLRPLLALDRFLAAGHATAG